MATLEVREALLNYEVWRSQDSSRKLGWVTLVNGHTRPLNDFRMFGKKLVAHGFDVLAFDNRGAGLTTVSAGFSISDMTNDVRELWNAVGIEKTHLMGISMGGFLCQLLAIESPSKLERMILVSTSSRHDSISSDERPWSTDIDLVFAKLATYFTPQFAERNAALVKSMAKQITLQVQKGAFVKNSQLQRQALDGFDITSRLSEVDVPVLVIHGEGDAIIPVEEGEALARNLKSAKLAKLPGVGHLLLAEAPVKLSELVISFLVQG